MGRDREGRGNCGVGANACQRRIREDLPALEGERVGWGWMAPDKAGLGALLPQARASKWAGQVDLIWQP
jgi:hypothetical protein